MGDINNITLTDPEGAGRKASVQCVNKTTPSHNHTIAHTCMLTQLHPLAMLLPALSALHQRELHLFQAGFSPKPRSLSSIQTRPIRILHSASRRLLLLIKLKRRKGSTLSRMRRLLVLLIFSAPQRNVETASLFVFTAALSTYVGRIMRLCGCVRRGSEWGGYCGSMGWISILFTPLFTTAAEDSKPVRIKICSSLKQQQQWHQRMQMFPFLVSDVT